MERGNKNTPQDAEQWEWVAPLTARQCDRRGARSSQETTTSDATPDISGLLEELTLEEKVGQMIAMPLFTLELDDVAEYFTDLQVGACLFDGGSAPILDPEELARAVNRVQAFNIEHSNHGIPFLLGLDALHGNATVDGATTFPHNVGLGATRNEELTKRAGEVTGEAVRAIGADWNFAPTTDVQRDPRWGRYYEGYSEDAGLCGDLAQAAAAGIEEAGVGACVKHIAGYSVPENGNDRTSANVSMRDLRTNVLPAYETALDAEPETVMVNSGAVNGVPAHASDWLLTTLLRERWGFDGLVVSDWQDFTRMMRFHDYVPSYRDAIERGINAGVDMLMFPSDPDRFVTHVLELVESGRIPEDRIDDAVTNVLEFKANVGLFEDPYVDAAAATESVSAGRALAQELAEQSMTLVKNEDSALPIENGSETILLTGPATDSVDLLTGGWTLGWQLIGDEECVEESPAITTIVEAMETSLPRGSSLVHEPTGFSPVSRENYDEFTFDNEESVATAASDASVVVVTLAEGPYAEWYGDRDELALPDAQRDLVQTIANATDEETDVIGVMLAGRPRGTAVTLDHLDALLMAYLPGTAGGTAIANTLYGKTNPSGRLPFVWPAGVGTLPEYHNAFPEARDLAIGPDDDAFDRDPLFEFGHGLSYTEFIYHEFSVSPEMVASPGEQQTVTAEVTVENAGERDGEHVVDVFAEQSYGSVMHPRRRLLQSERIALDQGETTTVTMTIPLRRLEVVPGSIFGTEEQVVEASDYTLAAGDKTTTLHVEATESVSNNGRIDPH